jgi:hypothetical protein
LVELDSLDALRGGGPDVLLNANLNHALGTKLARYWLEDKYLLFDPDPPSFYPMAFTALKTFVARMSQALFGMTPEQALEALGYQPTYWPAHEMNYRPTRTPQALADEWHLGQWVLEDWIMKSVHSADYPELSLADLGSSKQFTQAFYATPVTGVTGHEIDRLEAIVQLAAPAFAQMGIPLYAPIFNDSPRLGKSHSDRLEVYAQDERAMARSCIAFLHISGSFPCTGLGVISKLASNYRVHRVLVGPADRFSPMIRGDGLDAEEMPSPEDVGQYIETHWAQITGRAIRRQAELEDLARQQLWLIGDLGDELMKTCPDGLTPQRWHLVTTDPAMFSSLRHDEQILIDRMLTKKGREPHFAIRSTPALPGQVTVSRPTALPGLSAKARDALRQAADEAGWNQDVVRTLELVAPVVGDFSIEIDQRAGPLDPVFWYKLYEHLFGNGAH